MWLFLAVAAAEAAPQRYVCAQSNPTPGATHALRFAIAERAPMPGSVLLIDLEAEEVRVASRRPTRERAYDLVEPERIAWWLGADEVGTEYVLRLPPGTPAEQVEVEVVALFGGGRAQWVNEFLCVAR